MKQNLLKSALVILTCLIIFSCRKSGMKPESTAAGTSMPPGLFISNEQAGAGTLSFYNFGTRQFTPDQYNAVNSKTLGDLANDLEIYGSKMYIALPNSSVIDIVNAKTGKLLRQDSLLSPVYGPFGYVRKPINIAFYKGNAYISCSDGTIAIMDTVNLSVNAKITLTGFFYLEGLVVQNDKLYVADSGAGPGVTDIVSVIDLSTNQEIKRINVVPNPVSMAADSYGNVYVLSGFTDDWNQFDISTGGLSIIDSKTDNLKSPPVVGQYPGSNIPITVNGDLVYYPTYATGNNKIAVYNAKTQTAVTDNFITDGTNIQYPYSICANPVTGEVYISDVKNFALNGAVYVFDKTGKLEYSFATGVNPVKIKLVD